MGLKITNVLLHPEKRIFREIKKPDQLSALIGTKLMESHHSGKQMIFCFGSHHWLGVHLGMTGKLHWETPDYQQEKHDHLVIETKKGQMVFTDPRLFGKLKYHHGESEPEWWKNRAPDVLSDSFTSSYMIKTCKESRRPVKAILLDQSIFPGVGNWMADEILWRARLMPNRIYAELAPQERQELYKRARQVCRDAMRVIAPDWSKPPDNWLFNHRWKDGGTCPKTRKPLTRETIAGRTTCYSPAWQR
ncbi:MAG: DNA-formamidopyrimidine glycosylase family protein [Verrucomicrobiota bacterium]